MCTVCLLKRGRKGLLLQCPKYTFTNGMLTRDVALLLTAVKTWVDHPFVCCGAKEVLGKGQCFHTCTSQGAHGLTNRHAVGRHLPDTLGSHLSLFIMFSLSVYAYKLNEFCLSSYASSLSLWIFFHRFAVVFFFHDRSNKVQVRVYEDSRSYPHVRTPKCIDFR